jgi:hypothetical protein
VLTSWAQSVSVQKLDISKNSFNSDDQVAALALFLRNAVSSVSVVNLAETYIPAASLWQVQSSLGTASEIDLSSNEYDGQAMEQALQGFVAPKVACPNLKTLHLNNNLQWSNKDDLSGISAVTKFLRACSPREGNLLKVDYVALNGTAGKKYSLRRNILDCKFAFRAVNSRCICAVFLFLTLEVLTHMMYDSALIGLDVRGHQFADDGARILARVLLCNRKLRVLLWDGNNASIDGFRDIERAIAYNNSLVEMPIPVENLAVLFKVESDIKPLEEILEKIRKKINSNFVHRMRFRFCIFFFLRSCSRQQIL